MKNMRKLMPFMAIPIVVFAFMLLLRAVSGGPPPPSVQVNAGLCAMSTSTPFLVGGEHLFNVSTSTLRIGPPLVRATLSDSTAVGARAGERHAFAVSVDRDAVRVLLSEAGAAVLDGERILTAELTVRNAEGDKGRASIGVALNTARLSPHGDGGC